ncbi:protein of unknown function [Taphrina deformans PYCC 5710]|uniref:Glycine zipper 2TM domain-containing protein n=1 Tax=Taphrina deformans (strain PYCC 5710 / ATCC 11124 / CBS 356.35 / IMI 108563 / JCM 9778 / NBRC 8474) TaxID=1097556 RepID=R4XAK3_TAPDE|nr:protein of unknown function [Taphrina deformans PYCC 5710]|eukprot:CCG82818.1 protein of unknown function [Taphrina deformans PYCC 5710]
MASNSYYGNSDQNYQQGNQQNYQQQQQSQIGGPGHNPNESYGASYGQPAPYGQGSYDQQGPGQYGGYQGDTSTYQGQGQGQGQVQGGGDNGQTFAAQQTYADGSRDQKYDAQGNPILPNGERGLLGDLAGAAGGAYLGHKAGHGFLGAIAGGIGAHLLGDVMGKNKHNKYGSQQGFGGGLFGRRDIDPNDVGAGAGVPQAGYGQVPESQQGYHGQQSHQSQQQQFGQQGATGGFQGAGDQAYGQNYGR